MTLIGVPAGPLVGLNLKDGSSVKVARGGRPVPFERNAWMKCWPPKSAGTTTCVVKYPVALVWVVPRVLWEVRTLIPVTCGVGEGVITQVAFEVPHSRVRAVLAGRPVPVTVMVAPTMAAVGKTVIAGEAAAALAGLAIKRTHKRADVVASDTLRAPAFDGGHFARIIGRSQIVSLIRLVAVLDGESGMYLTLGSSSQAGTLTASSTPS